MTVRPVKTQIKLGICPVWSESSLSAWRKVGSLATHWAHSEDWSDWADAQADLSLCWVHISVCWFCHEAAQIIFPLGSHDQIQNSVYNNQYVAECMSKTISIEPQHDTTNKMTCMPIEDADQPVHPPSLIPVWLESSLCTSWVANVPMLLQADSKDSNQTGRMPRLIWVFAGRTGYFVCFVMRRLSYNAFANIIAVCNWIA